MPLSVCQLQSAPQKSAPPHPFASKAQGGSEIRVFRLLPTG
jgi:hypothetical protein